MLDSVVGASGQARRCRVLAHVHTRRSSDASISARQIVDYARTHSIDAVIVTDHNTHLGSTDCAELSGDGPLFPMSAEYKSTSGDIIAACLSRPLLQREPMALIQEAHAQGALIILPHPYRGSHFSDRILEEADIIEVFNSRCSDELNARALATAQALGKPGIVGADAHLAHELGLALNEYDAPLTADLRSILFSSWQAAKTEHTTMRSIRRSQMIKARRRMRPILFAKNLVRWVQSSPTATP